MSKEELIEQMYTDYCELARVDDAVKWLTADEFQEQIIGEGAEAFDEAYIRWAASGYVEDFKPILVFPDDSIMKDPRFEAVFQHYLKEYNITGTNEELQQLKRNMATTSAKLLKDPEMMRMQRIVNERLKDEGVR